MMIRLSTVHEDAQGIPLLLKEGLGVVDQEAGAGGNHPLPPPLPRTGVAFMTPRGPESGQQKRKEPGKWGKNVKIEGTNSISPVESVKVSKNELKTNWFLSARSAKRTPKNGQKATKCPAPNPNERVRMNPIRQGVKRDEKAVAAISERRRPSRVQGRRSETATTEFKLRHCRNAHGGSAQNGQTVWCRRGKQRGLFKIEGTKLECL
jgi:hypothetical protein